MKRENRDGTRRSPIEENGVEGEEGGIIASGYRVLLPYVPCMRVTAFRSDRSPPSPLSLVRPVKINKGTINKNYTFFIHLAREGLGWVGFGWLRPTIAAIPSWSSPPPPRLEPSPLRFQPSISPFFWKEKEKEEEVRKKFSSIDRWTVFEEEDSRDGEYNWSIFFFFPQDGLFSFGFQRNCPNRTARNYRSTFRTEGDINLLLRISKIPDILLFPPYLYQDVP